MTDPIKAIIGGQVRTKNSPVEQAAHQALPWHASKSTQEKWHSVLIYTPGTAWASGGPGSCHSRVHLG